MQSPRLQVSGSYQREREWLGICFICVAILVVALSALTRAVNHDESQYVAAIALARHGLPYRDFAYLQTPLQPLLLSPLGYLPAGWVIIGARCANAAFGAATILLLLRALRNRVALWAALSSLAALLCTDAFLLACSLARNDALAMVLLAAAVLPLLSALETRRTRWFALAGLALGLATSAKISAALPAAGAAIFVLVRVRRDGARGALALGAGFLAGLLPSFVMASLALDSFKFEALTYNLQAPAQWWNSIGQGVELDPFRRATKLVGFACLGSVLVGLLATLLIRGRSEVHRLLDCMIVGGVVAALLPAPALVQYLVPLLPPLFARFAFALNAAPPRIRNWLLVLAATGSIAGLAASMSRFAGLELLRSTEIGASVASLAHGGRVATLAPEYVAGAGVILDERFATGPFLYRTRGPLARMAEVNARSATVEAIDQALSTKRPAVILAGAERDRFLPVFPKGLDDPLVTWAIGRGYRPVPLKSGLVAFVEPR